jgi:tRNA-dihydrouridine synthase 4
MPILLFSWRSVNLCASKCQAPTCADRYVADHLHSYGVDLAYTPMILADVVHRSPDARDADFTTHAADTPVVVQFAARVPIDMERASQLVANHVAAVDLNCGCPQRWAYQEGIGSRLMEEPETVRDIVRQVKAHVGVPCSVKIRIHRDLRETMEYARQMEMAGADWITVHGRTRHQRSSEPVNVDAIRMVKEQSNVPIIANGDIFSLDDADRMYAATKADGTC